MRAIGLWNISEIDNGCFTLRHPLFPAERCAEALADSRAFFELPVEAKQALAIEGSPHFRGYSEMRNERDWREQIHLGREEPAQGGGPAYMQLCGPNRWPEDSRWRARVQRLMADLESAGREILAELGARLGLPEAQFLGVTEEPYLLLKMICYQPTGTAAPRSGVAPHVDFSWITLLIQDDTGGLEMRSRGGDWVAVPPQPGALVVNAGEILEFASRGHYRATPHRVVNRSGTRARLSLPFFLNPALCSPVRWAPVAGSGERVADGEHVHRVFSGNEREFVFGEEEWKRKGLGNWCGECASG